jgi:hypothetical protein
MIINPQMGYSELVELYGDELGFSIGKALRKTKNAVKTVAKPVVRTVAKPIARNVVKAAKVVGRNAGNIAVAATVVPTGGLSLLAKKKVRNVVGTAARKTQSAVFRPVAHVAANTGRSAASSALVQKAAGSAIRSFVPGGSAALDSLSLVRGLNKKKPAPMAAKKIPLPPALKQRSAAGQVGQTRPYHVSAPASAPAAAAADAAPSASPFPILPVAIGGAGLLLVAVMAMGKKK